ncbi:MAG TPA: deoxyribose-phosphate aldolase [Solirubrobacteraceae bacterium]|nr:deoxyribose-phosphate aldolase [Solirubrobacteraceae bacterium]
MSAAVALLDLTGLEEDAGEARVAALCAQARTGPVAAVCIAPRFVGQAAAALAGSPVRVATVANFPAGLDDPRGARAEAERAVAEGAQEVDVVFPYLAFAAGDRVAALAVVVETRAATRGATLKVTLEAQRLETERLIRTAATAALDAGADFVCTATGKLSTGASPAAARVMLEAVRDHGRGGFKAGAVRDAREAAAYLALADEVVGAGWTAPDTFRLGVGSEAATEIGS